MGLRNTSKLALLAFAIAGVWALSTIRVLYNLPHSFPKAHYALIGQSSLGGQRFSASTPAWKPSGITGSPQSLLVLQAIKAGHAGDGDQEGADIDTGDIMKGLHGRRGQPQKTGPGVKDDFKFMEDSLSKAALLRKAATEQLNKLVYVSDGDRLIVHQRQFVIWNTTLKVAVKRNFVEYKSSKDINTTEYRFPASVVERLFEEDPGLSYATCAVVGNSGVSLLTSAGAEIDSHDAVIRMNLAPVRGFEDHVGSRTTFQVVNSPNIREMLAGSLPWQRNDNRTRLVMFETSSGFARAHLASVLMDEFQDKALLLNPSFAEHCLQVWQTLKRSVELDTGREFHKKPMSGFFATMMALQMCGHVDLYGFDAYTGSKMKNLYHYFDHVQGFTDVHSFDLAMHIFRKIEDIGLISIRS